MSEIEVTIERYRSSEEAERGLMEYYDKPDLVNEKIRSLTIDMAIHDGRLWAEASIALTEPLTPDELNTLREYIEGQYSDGWGEGFEQQDIKIEDGVLHVHLWKSGDEFYIDTQEQFAERLGIILPADALSQSAMAKESSEVMQPNLEELEQRLRDRLEKNYNVYKREMMDLSKDKLFEAAAEIAQIQESYEYFTKEYFFEESEISFLLKFKTPLELISDKWGEQFRDVSTTIRAIFGDQERTLENGGYILASDEPEPASELARNVANNDGKTSVIERIRRAAEEKKERPAAPDIKNNRKKSEEEL
jgi:hypothetical protein